MHAESTKSPHFIDQQVVPVCNSEQEKGLLTWDVTQNDLVTAMPVSDYGSEGWGFESLRARCWLCPSPRFYRIFYRTRRHHAERHVPESAARALAACQLSPKR